jgi:hypothetical protein
MASLKRQTARAQRTTVVNGMLCFVLILVVLQLWLLTATMNAWMGGDPSVVWPAALASLGCFAANLVLVRRLHYLTGDGK